jgi:hypothetical protein
LCVYSISQCGGGGGGLQKSNQSSVLARLKAETGGARNYWLGRKWRSNM